MWKYVLIHNSTLELIVLVVGSALIMLVVSDLSDN